MSTDDDATFEPPIPEPGEASADTEPLQAGEQSQRPAQQPSDPLHTPEENDTPVAPGEGTTQPKPEPGSPQRGL